MTERIKLNLLFKLSNLNSNFALTLGYLNPALNNPAQHSNFALTPGYLNPALNSPNQKRALRIMMDAPWDAPSTALLSELNILPFQERVAKLKAKMASKALNRLLPSYIAEKFLRFSAVHVRETKNSKRNLKLPRITQSHGQRSFMFSAASLWNRLPEEFKDCSTLTSFENKLKRIEVCVKAL